MENREPIDQSEWRRLEGEHPTATPERREHIDELLDEMEWKAWQNRDD